MDEVKPHLVKQVNHFSDGSEQVINYRGVVEQDGSVTLDKPEEGVAAAEAAPAEEAVETPAEAPVEPAPEAVPHVAEA